jgi:hypothetical protein
MNNLFMNSVVTATFLSLHGPMLTSLTGGHSAYKKKLHAVWLEEDDIFKLLHMMLHTWRLWLFG